MVAPNVKTQEIDQSYRVSTGSASSAGIVIPAKKGPTTPTLITSDTEYLKYYTANEQVEVGDTFSHFSALAVLAKSNSLWVNRAIPADALYAGSVVKAIKGDSETAENISDPSAFIFDSEGAATGVAQKSSISCKLDIDGSLFGTYFYLPGHKNYVWYHGEDADLHKCIDKITIAEDLSALKVEETAEAKYMILPDAKSAVYFIYKDDKEYGVKPENVGIENLIKVEVTKDETAETLAEKLKLVILSNKDMSAEILNADGTIQIETKCDIDKLGDRVEYVPGFSTANGVFTCINIQEGIAFGEDPKPTLYPDAKGLRVDIKANNAASTIAKKTADAIKVKLTEFDATNEDQSAELILTSKETKQMDPIEDGTTGFDFNTLQFGSEDAGKPAMLIYSANQGAWGNDIVYKIYNYADYPTKVNVPNAFLIKVYKKSNLNIELESFVCSLAEDAKDDYGNNIYAPLVLQNSFYIRAIVNTDIESKVMPASDVKGSILAGGSDGSVVTDGEMIKAVKAFENKDSIKLTLLIDGGHATPAYGHELERIAKKRGDCFAILSTPENKEFSANYKNDLVSYRKNELNLNSSYAALMTSHVQMYDYFNNRNIWVAPDGYVAGALLDAERNYEIWYPVLGFKRGVLDVTDVRQEFDSGTMDYLYDNGLNPIRKVSGKGIVIWGQKTLQSAASALDRINVRMMLVKVEPAIEEYLENYIGEFNTATTRSEVKSIIEDYLDDIQSRNGCRGYSVICDSDNNDSTVIENNELIVWVYIKPPYGVEYITNKMIITPEGISLDSNI